ncbi:MAG: polyamine ABC transporter ATP-binding protein [SAR116 cluster bacterium]|nr:polyamine ABC transporter ATP-binding protein [SAR116 cluster bacterium]RPG98304.1 MAG: ABC transporter ATP-binding protein [Candidatus Puniceispirillum sp. TMED176]
MSPFIRIRNVTRRFGDVVAVDDLSLDIDRGELFCLLGASGCGKTTLLRMLAGFERVDSGSIEIDGIDMAAVPPAARPVNIMFQNYALFPHMSVADNIAYGLRRAGLPKPKIVARLEELLRLFRLTGMGGRKPHQLSGGQRQRVALARALARRPKLLLLDEPLAALDKKLREDTQFELVDIQERLETTFIVVTHDQEEAMTLASRIGVMDAGKLVQVDTPRTLYDRPRNQFIADFLGTVSFLDGVVTSVADGRVMIDGTVPVTAVDPGGFAVGDAVRMAIRPEKIALGPDARGAVNEIPVTVEDLAFTGVATNYRVIGPDGMRLKLTQPNQRGDVAALEWEQQGFVSFDPADVVLLRD